MKNLRITLIIPVLLTTMITWQCKKSSKNTQNQNPQTTAVKYMIDPVSNTLILIRYTDENGNNVDITDWSKFSGTQTVNITQKPFKASLHTEATNPGNTTVYFTMAIFVNDSVTTYKSCAIPPASSGNVNDITYTIP